VSSIEHRSLLVVVAVVAAVAVAGMAALWPRDVGVEEEPDAIQTTALVDATLLEIVELGEDDFGLLPGAVIVEIAAEIETTGEIVVFDTTDETGDTYQPGQRVKLAVIGQEGQPPTYFISDFRRDRPLLVLALLFFGAVVAFGRWQGLRALIGLALTFVILIGFLVPAILAGRSPVAVAVFGALAIMIITLYLSHGFSAKTTAAVVGTAGALLLTGLLALVFVAAAQITGFASEEARLANLQVGGLSLRGLLLAGIIIGGLGVLDDVTMSQASTVFQLHRANPAAGFADLLRGGIAVGRDHIAATVNTLFLAYAGAALPLLILFVVGTDPVGTILTAEIVAVEIVRTLVGSIGLIAAVPLTTALAAAVVIGRVEPDEPPAETDAAAGADDAAPAPEAGDEEWEERLRDAYGLSSGDEAHD
jgi:uncharacterized membrane protein